MSHYQHAWESGRSARGYIFYVRPFWRGRKYLKAWDNGFSFSRLTVVGTDNFGSNVESLMNFLFAALVGAVAMRWISGGNP